MIVGLLRSKWILGYTYYFILTTLAITFVQAMIATIILSIRHDIITIFIGMPSAIIGSIGSEYMAPFIFVVLFTFPYIGAVVGRDMRKLKEKNKFGQQGLSG